MVLSNNGGMIMPQVPGTKIWLKACQLNTVCHMIEDTPPMGRLMIAYEYALKSVQHAKQALSNTKRVQKFIIWYWFNMGHVGGLDINKFTSAMEAEGQE